MNLPGVGLDRYPSWSRRLGQTLAELRSSTAVARILAALRRRRGKPARSTTARAEIGRKGAAPPRGRPAPSRAATMTTDQIAIHLNDVVDVLVVTALLYTLLVWLRRTQAAFVALGITIVGALALVARYFDLRLTAWIFQGFFAVFLVVIVVIFQEELRQFFERLGVFSLRRGRMRARGSQPIDMLLTSAADFARDRIGALIVLPGRQPIQRHIRGGIELNGILSVPILKSIFDPHSPGHDGAVIVENGVITRFAAHLPLSQDFLQLAGVGTRHSAALGLAELSDALCLVVSEERGQISVAHEGRLREIADAHELGAVLHRFMHGPEDEPSKRRLWAQLALEHWVEKAAALILTIGLWYLFVPGSRPETVTYQVPVAVDHVPAELVLDKAEPAAVEVTFSGPRRAFYLFDPRKLEVTLDGSRADAGRDTFDITDENLRYPRELKVEELRPEKVKLSFRRAESPARRSEARR